VREASELLFIFYQLMSDGRRTVHRDEKTVEKAIWMLQVDALDSLRDCLRSLIPKRHRIAGKLFRDIVETLDLAAYFASRCQESNRNLEKWYQDEVIPHRVYREFVKKTEDEDFFEEKKRIYSNLSKFTHRTYRAICDGYILASEDRLAHDAVTMTLSERNEQAETFLVTPEIISAYFANLASLILVFSNEVHKRGTLSEQEVSGAMARALESDIVRRRYVPRRLLKQRIESE
jgi:hypothetical protein